MVIHPYNYNLWSLLTKARKYIRVPEEVKEAVLQSLELTDGKLTNGTSSLVLNSAPHLLWACRHSESIVSYTQKKENQACFILTWHIATCYCELATLKYFRASVGGNSRSILTSPGHCPNTPPTWWLKHPSFSLGTTMIQGVCLKQSRRKQFTSLETRKTSTRP